MTMVDCDLLVVGLGPTGDTLAALASIYGLKVIAVDKEHSVYPLPRAAVFDQEVMRIFQMIGIAKRIEPLCRAPDRYEFLTADGQILLDFPNLPNGKFGWAEIYALHQPAVETLLRERLVELGVDVRLGATFTELDQHEDHVDVEVVGPDGPTTIRTRYLAGCDGSWSPVREALGATLENYGFDEPWLVIDTIVEEIGDLPIRNCQICDPKRPVTYMAMSGRRFRWEFMLKPGETPSDMLDEATIRELLEPWKCSDRLTIERKAVYRFHALVADRWQSGRVLIAGDAAHQMPPFAGQGMCSGIRDAANLAWKLAMVIKKQADQRILGSFQVEREPHVRAIIETAIAMGKVVCMLDAEAAAARDREMLERKRQGAQDVSVEYPPLHGGLLTDTPASGSLFPQPVAADGRRLDDLLGIGPVLVSDASGSEDTDTVDVRRLAIDDLRPFAADIRAWLNRSNGTAVLVRPDRHVFGTGDPGALLEAWRRALKPEIPAPRHTASIG
jgi:3-(3-hydroxy-phenyl)propionate hydroxylase